MEITIKDKTYKVKYSLRALFIFEQIKKEPFALKTITDYYLFFYCMLLASDSSSELTFDDFIDTLDENPEIATEMMQYLTKENEKNAMFDEKKKVMEKI
jgi:spore coat polysaccharide biosynthesis protein SpsF (cytidylyltransferase family)